MGRPAINLTGLKFGNLVVIERVFTEIRGVDKHAKWLCKCDCGNTKILSSDALKSGRYTNCGQHKSEKMLGQKNPSFKHGLYKHRLFNIWQSMKSRCYISTSHGFQWYGGRGIKICDEWREDFKAFYDWAIANGYNENLSIDRIDVNGNYEPSNCRWETMKEQANNRRTNKFITYNGETKTLSEWADVFHLKGSIVRDRIYKQGWSVEKAFTTPIDERRK